MKTPNAETATEVFEDALVNANQQQYALQLYVAGGTQKSLRAIADTRSFCEEFLKGRYQLEIVDLTLCPTVAQTEQIIAIPTLVRTLPGPVKRIIGDLTHRQSLASLTDIEAMSTRLEEVEETLDALRSGRVDALVVTGRDGESILSLRSAAEELAERKRHDAQLEYQANYDALTGLANRHLLQDRLQQALISAARYGHEVTVAFIDLDNFKYINDSLGHHIGDQLLQAISYRLRSSLRETDTVARNGGDEFVLVIDRSDESVISLIMRKVLNAVSEPVTIDGHELLITCSIGLSMYPIDGPDANTLLRHADAAMYHAKEQGRNNFQLFTPELNVKINSRMAMEANLRQALERGEFFLHYQPKVDLRTGHIVGVEALIRWKHNDSVISPADFIPLAEEIGLIVPIGAWVLRTACAQNKAWQHGLLPKIKVAVNLSARQFKDKTLVQLVGQVLQETGLDAKYLELELTESMVMQNVESTVTTLRDLKDMGVTLSIDDFGTGYSSLSYLKRFPIDVLKIDQSFIRDITSDPDDAAIAASIISLALSLKLKVIAEGVETEAQLSYLRRHQCDEIQGYFFSRPVLPHKIEHMLRQSKSLPAMQDDMVTDRPTLLVVDDEMRVLVALKQLLRNDGYHILSASSAEDGFRLLALNPVQVILCDQQMPVMNGTQFLNTVKELYPDTIRIVLSGYTDLESIMDAINRGAIYRFYTKPWDDDLLRANIQEAFRHHWLLHRNPLTKIGGLDRNSAVVETSRDFSLDAQELSPTLTGSE